MSYSCAHSYVPSAPFLTALAGLRAELVLPNNSLASDRRGSAIDLVLGVARPGARIPHAKALATETIYVDSRERYGYRFAEHGVACVKRALRARDYAVARDGAIVAAVERKTIDDFAGSLGTGALAFAMAELSQIGLAAVVVEGTYSMLLRHPYTRTGFFSDLLARVQVRHPSFPIVFLESRKLAPVFADPFEPGLSRAQWVERIAP